MAKDITCTQVVVNKAVSNCNAEENIEFKFSFDIKIKLTEEITEEFDKKIKEAEDKVKPELDKKKDELEKKKEEIEQKVKDVENKIKPELDSKKNELDSKKNELDSKIKEAMDKTSPELDKKKKELDEEIKKLGDKIPSELAKKKEELDRKIEESKSKIESELDRKKEKLSKKITDETKKEIEKIKEIKKNIKDTKKGIEEKTKEIEGLNKKKKEVEDEIQKKKKEKDNIEGGIKKIEDQLTKDKEDIDKEKKDKIANIPNLIEPILDAIKVNLLIDESVVVKDIRTIQKPLKTVLASTTTATDAEATTELVFPEALAGARLKINYAFEYTSTADVRKVNIAAGLESSIDIKRADLLQEIEKVYWSDQEHAKWGAVLSQQKEISNNEVGFLHIYTKGMFGHEIWTELMEEDLLWDDSLGKEKKIMRDNVLSIPYSMDNVLSTYKSKFLTLIFEGKTLELYGRCHTEKKKLRKGLKSPILYLKIKEKAKDPQKSTTGTDVKVQITTDEEAIPTPTKAKCILQFRPKKASIPVPNPPDGYCGDYGFDWVRIGDTNMAMLNIGFENQIPTETDASGNFKVTPPDPSGNQYYIRAGADYHNDFAYEDFMGVHYYNGPHTDWTGVNRPSTNQIEHNGNSRGNVFKYDKELNDTPKVCRPDFHYDDNQKKWVYLPSTTPDQTFGDGRMYKKFTHRFRRLLFNWNPKAATPAHHETYTPIMTIMNGKFADLDLYLDIKEEPKEIILEFDNKEANTYLSLDKTILSGNLSKTVSGTAPSTTDKTNHKLKITCTGEFDQEYTLFARAFKKDASDGTIDKKGEVCGMLRILPNGKMYQRKVKIYFISVITDLNGSPKHGSSEPNADKILKDVLGQGLVIPQIITKQKNGLDLTIDTSNPKSKKNKGINFKDNFCTPQGLIYVIDNSKAKAMRDYFFNELEAIDNNAYKNAFKVFLIDENLNASTIGYSWDLGTPYIVCFNTTKNYDSVIAHEILHALELAHPFDAYSRNTPFSHHFGTTNNIMDYSQTFHILPNSATKINPVNGKPLPADAIGLFHWQWQIINSKIR